MPTCSICSPAPVHSDSKHCRAAPAHATFVEMHRPTADALRAAARDLGLTDRTTVLSRFRPSGPRGWSTGRFDLVFADPPYVQAFPAPAFAALREREVRSMNVRCSSTSTARATPRRPIRRSCSSAPPFYGEVALAFLRPEPR